MAAQQIRNAKLQQRYRSLSCGERTVPELRLSGVWLEEQGFRAGVSVDIRVSRGRLVITPRRGGGR